MDLAATAPRSVQAVAKIRGLGNQKSDWLAKQLVSLIEQADSVPKNEWPQVAEKKPKERAPAAVLEMLRVLLKHVCDEAKILVLFVGVIAFIVTNAVVSSLGVA